MLHGRLITGILAAILSFTVSGTAYARKIPTALCGKVYLTSGDSIVADGTTRIAPPLKNKKLEIIENAYTRRSKVGDKLAPEAVDSVVLWVPTAPERTHTLRYVGDYGWCWEIERNPYLTVCCFSPKGYFFAGNGGVWTRGKGVMIVIKDGKTYNFGKSDKKVDGNMRRRLESLVADDADLTAYIRKARGRCDKIVRSLGRYKPDDK